MRKLLLGFGFLPILIGCQQVIQNTDDTIIIGGIAPLTGDAASYGELSQNVTELRIEQVNQAGGVNGKPVQILWEDSKCNPNDATKAAQKLINVDKVSVITGFSCSGAILGVAPLAEKNEVILMGILTSSAEITNAGAFIFRTAPSDASQGRVLAEYANGRFERVGILSEQTDYAMGIADTFVAEFAGEVMREDFLNTESDFKTRITKLKNANLDALLISVQAPPKFEIIAKQLQEQRWNLPIIGNEMVGNNTEIVEQYKNLLTQTGAVSASFVAPENEKFNTFLQTYKERYGKEPPYLNYAALAVDAADVLAKVLGEVKDIQDTKALRDALYATQNFEGMFDSLSFDKNGDVNISYSLFQFNGEKFAPLKN